MFSKFFIDHPVFASVIAIVTVLIGSLSIPLLPVEKTPDITPPTVVVQASYPGANAQTVSDTVATPIEQAINGVDHLLYMSSNSTNDGQMQLTVTFEVGTDVDIATVLVQNRVATAQGVLPAEVLRQGINIQKQSPNIILVASLISPTGQYDETYMSNYINIRMKDELARVPGVGNITIFGARDFAMRLWLDPDKLKARNLTTTDILNAVRSQNIEVTAGQIGSAPNPKNQQFQYSIQTLGRLSTPEQFANIILKAQADGKILRLKDVARIELGADNYNWYVNYMGRPSIGVAFFQTPGSNALNVAVGIKAALDDLAKNFPQGLEYRIPYNPTAFISEAIDEIIITLGFTCLLVILSVYIFLQDWRATLIPSIAIPVSLIGTFAIMIPLGMSINTLTMFGLVLVIGIVVDDAIIVVENCSRLMEEESLPPKQAAIKAMQQISGPVIATTLVLLAVFVPTVVMGGITGRLYQQFGITISVALLISGVNALTLSPALCALFLKPPHESSTRFGRAFNKFMKKTTTGYVSMVASIIRKSFVTMIIFVIMVVVALVMLKSLPTGFIPDEDEGSFFVNVRLPDGSTIDRTRQVMTKITDVLKNTPGIHEYISVAGFSILDNAQASNGGVCFINLEPWSKRKAASLSVFSIVNRLQGQFFTFPDAMVFAFTPPPIRGLGRAGGFELQLQDRGGAGLMALSAAADNLIAKANAGGIVTRLNSTLRANVPQLYVDIDRVKALSLGVPMDNVFNTLGTYLGSSFVNNFTLFGRNYRVLAQAENSFRTDKDNIRDLEVRNNKNQMLPLGTFVTVKDIVGPQSVTHYNIYPSTMITGISVPPYSSGQAITEMQKLCNENLSSDINYQWSGVSLQQISASTQTSKIFIIASIFAFLFLAAQYESWTIPFAIIFAVPIALLGAVLFTWTRGFENNIYTQIGIVLLIGLASKTSILLVEFAKTHHEAGHSIFDSALEAARLRLRPVLMTAFAFIFGVFPLIIATGAGAVSRRNMGTAVFGGMLIGTFVGLLMIPVFYVVIQKLTDKMKGKSKKQINVDATSKSDEPH